MQKRWSTVRAALAVGLLAAGGALAQTAAAPAASAGCVAFGPGEQSTYKVAYLGVTAGSTQVTVGAPTKFAGQEVWPIVSVAKSDPDLGVWPIKDKYVTYFHPVRQTVLGSDLFADENRKRRRQRVKLDDTGKSAVVVKQKEGEPPHESTHELPPGTTDVAGATFALRNRPLKVGESYSYPVFTGSKSFTLAAHVEGRQKIKTPLGLRDVVRVRVKTEFSGKLESKRDIVAFFSDDPFHVPLRIEADFVVGTMVAELTDYKQGRDLAALGPMPGSTAPASGGSGGR
ncbi:DUF3108 domain-containing protein [Aggregicoccus sp. 17bor-14]|uniref:DUF3108 domain-containing protein n=1 Tax=Myxococcaceae TaxID=31 RepID=UPI00129C6583|nr:MULTISPECIES: DUF3108 domain-containing protein [Myxococcaceae]MBF5041454.1 DUF3108 domain-containing protein [Simulacricoccus sp. 17bor-14]MRI87238.1 DUF3108 domain-containing protein [Aggregicoccus sp. 17bor-14]